MISFYYSVVEFGLIILRLMTVKSQTDQDRVTKKRGFVTYLSFFRISFNVGRQKL